MRSTYAVLFFSTISLVKILALTILTTNAISIKTTLLMQTPKIFRSLLPISVLVDNSCRQLEEMPAETLLQVMNESWGLVSNKNVK